MAATSAKANTPLLDFEAAAERARDANERLLDASRKVSGVYLDGLEKYVAGLAALERKISEQSQSAAAASLFEAHAKLTEELARASVSAARELISV